MSKVLRTCKTCGKKTSKQNLNRYVLRDAAPVLDHSSTMDGRGAYCCKNKQCNRLFLKNGNKWKRAFRIKL